MKVCSWERGVRPKARAYGADYTSLRAGQLGPRLQCLWAWNVLEDSGRRVPPLEI